MNKRKMGAVADVVKQKFGKNGRVQEMWSSVEKFVGPKSRLGVVLAVTAAFYLAAVFVREINCGYGLLGCGMEGFGVIFPFYIFFAALMRHLNVFWFAILYLTASSFYVYMAYLSGSWMERIMEDRVLVEKRK